MKMSLADWLKMDGFVRKNLQKKKSKIDWKFGIAYNAALKLCTILLHSSGDRPEKILAHYRTLQSLPLILGEKYKSDADYLDTCRKKRNEAGTKFCLSLILPIDQLRPEFRQLKQNIQSLF